MEVLACMSCRGSTPKGCSTVILARRITVRTRAERENVLDAEAVIQLCPDCSQRGRSEALQLRPMMPPLLDLESTTLLQYLRRIADGTELSETAELPLGCTLCRANIPQNEAFVFIELSTEVYEWKWISSPRQSLRGLPPTPPAQTIPRPKRRR